MEDNKVVNSGNTGIEAGEPPKKSRRGENLKPYHWKPGQSGNPSGRPKGSHKARQIIEDNAELAAKTLVKLLTEGNDRAKIKAAIDILDRDLGKAVQQVDINPDDGITVRLVGDLEELAE